MLRVVVCFSALQRAEIAEIYHRCVPAAAQSAGFSALQRAEIAEIQITGYTISRSWSFSALQRAEIAEMFDVHQLFESIWHVSVLFNEPKLLKLVVRTPLRGPIVRFSALQRAEIAEMVMRHGAAASLMRFQCSSTSRNC